VAYREAVELFRAADEDTTRVAKTLNALGDVAVSHGDTAEARRRWDEALALTRTDHGPDARHTEAFVTANLGDLAFEEGDVAAARELLERALALLAPRGDRWATAIVRRHLAKMLAAQGERAAASALLSESLALLRAWSERTEPAGTLEILVTLAAQQGEVERVVRLLAGAAAIRGAAGSPLGTHQRDLLARALAPASAALGRDVLGVAADRHGLTKLRGGQRRRIQAVGGTLRPATSAGAVRPSTGKPRRVSTWSACRARSAAGT
jgi:tetratricopeptide (TPR) repeat protein